MKDMTLNEYQLLAARTINPALTEDEVEQHALFCLASEVGEVGRMNIDKLRARYPDGFDTEHSIHRKANDI